jgi:hypothetical protein
LAGPPSAAVEVTDESKAVSCEKNGIPLVGDRHAEITDITNIAPSD